MTTTPNPNDLSAAVDYAASSPEDKFSNSRAFEETVLKIRDTIVNARLGDQVRSKIEAFVTENLPSMNKEYAVELCYKIAGVEPPEDDGFRQPLFPLPEPAVEGDRSADCGEHPAGMLLCSVPC